jgi:hypothetical protein
LAIFILISSKPSNLKSISTNNKRGNNETIA